MFDTVLMERLEAGPELARALLCIDVSELDAEGARVWVAASQRLERLVEARRYQVTAHYADLHPPQPTIGPRELCAEGTVFPGGDGTPGTGEFGVTELAVAAHCSAGRAYGLIGDGLDLRHRMPELFKQLESGAVDGFKVRMILRRTRHVKLLVARLVDRSIAGLAGRIGPTRLDAEIDKALLRLDPGAAADAAEDATAARRVRVEPARDGVRQLVGTVDAVHGLAFDAAVDFVADILGDLGDDDPKDARRATAVGWLANPPATLALVERHRAWRAGEAPAAWATTIVPDTGCVPEPAESVEPSAVEYAAAAEATAQGVDDDGFARADAGGQAPVTHPHLRPGLWPTDVLTPEDRVGADLWPAATVYVHMSSDAWQTGSGPVDLDGHGPITAAQAFDRLRHHRITIKPVIDLTDEVTLTTDAEEFAGRIREAVFAANRWNPFPFADAESRPNASAPATGRGHGDDVDHTIPEHEGGPTALGNGAPLRRRLHRLKTHAKGWRVRQPVPGIHVWQTPHGRVLICDRRGHTHDLGLAPAQVG
ncbi:MAG TPA: DUF222 domain-containing protein [Nocardioidaceae bacterium]|nr:DUF222 domain-containing protein [Nocardioidaceae bacterium]